MVLSLSNSKVISSSLEPEFIDFYTRAQMMGLLTQFQQITGACGNCASSETTMKMGIERVLKEKFGDAIQDIRQLSFEEPKETTVEASPI